MLNSKKGAVVGIAATAIVSMGLLSACGSNSATESPSPSETNSRDAGFFNKKVDLTITNDSGGELRLIETDVNIADLENGAGALAIKKLTTVPLMAGASKSYVKDEPGAIISQAGGSKGDQFVVTNPKVGVPYVMYTDDDVNIRRYLRKNMSEGKSFTWKSTTTGNTYVVTRNNDTSTKMVTIKVVK